MSTFPINYDICRMFKLTSRVNRIPLEAFSIAGRRISLLARTKYEHPRYMKFDPNLLLNVSKYTE